MKESEFEIISKQICRTLVTSGAVEEEVADMQAVRIRARTVTCSKRLNVVNFFKFTAYSSGELT